MKTWFDTMLTRSDCRARMLLSLFVDALGQPSVTTPAAALCPIASKASTLGTAYLCLSFD